MNIAKKSETGKVNSFAAKSLEDMAGKMDEWIRMAAAKGRALHEFESEWHEMIHRMANLGTGLFISQQGVLSGAWHLLLAEIGKCFDFTECGAV